MKSKLFLILLLTFFFKEIVWLTIIPLWHFPDEEQHFAQVSFLAEKKITPQKVNAKYDVSQEIDFSSQLLGTKRDERGNNRFTYHPEFRLPYTDTQVGLYEEKISQLNTKENRQKMVKREAARYGEAYYFLASLAYNLFYQNSLFSRVFSSRMVSVILSTLNIVVVYLIARQIFKSDWERLTLTFLVAFQPMLSFVSAGVNSDNLFNLIFSLILYLCLRLFFPLRKPNSKGRLINLFLLALVIALGFYTKKQIIICFPMIFFAFLLSLLKKSKKQRKKDLLLIIFAALVLGCFFRVNLVIPEYNPGLPSKLKETFFQYIFWHFKHTIAETIPWYWGVFNWLGVTLPRWFNRIQSRILVVAALGIIIFFIKQLKNKVLTKNKNIKIIFLLGAAIIYYLCIICWDYFFRQSQGFSFGIQGRYFFPTTVSHMLFIFLGILTLIPNKFKIFSLKLLNLWWVFFSSVGLYTAAAAYYQLWPIATFLNQVSQYKPGIFKASGLVIFFTLYLIVLFIYIINLFNLHERKIKSNN